jgi:hypothetical protein
MAKVQMKSNVRFFESDDSELILRGMEIKELSPRLLRSNDIKNQLHSGKMRVVEGELEFNFKNARVRFSASHPGIMYGMEFEKFFRKNLDMDTIEFVAREEVPADFPREELLVKEQPKEEKSKDEADLNKDGVVDDKDRSLAGRLLSSMRGRKKKKQEELPEGKE